MSQHADEIRTAVAQDDGASAIVASWRRCLTIHGLDPDRTDPPRRDLKALERSRSRDAVFLDVARPVVDQVFALLADQDCAVLLVDRNGILIDVRTNRAVDAWRRSPPEWLGTCYREETVGTSSVGTCLAEQRATIVRGHQHFLTRYTNRVGMCMPLYGPEGLLVGCLNLNQSTQAHDARLDSFLSISLSNFARRIETELFARAYPSTRLVLASPHGQRLDALLAVDLDDRVIGATRGARRLLALGDNTLARAPNVAEVFAPARPRDDCALADVERRAIVAALARHGGNHSAAARAIGISRSTLYRKLKAYEAVAATEVVGVGVGAQTSDLGLKPSSALMRFDSPSRTSR